MENNPLSVSQAVALINQTLEAALPAVLVDGEVASFKVSKGKYVYFDIKDETSTLNCFMSLFAMRVPLADGMTVRLAAEPKLTAWGRFSLTVRAVQPLGRGSLRRSFEILKDKLASEGLFAPERKRPLPKFPQRVGVITSTDAAGYRDFLKVLESRWGGMELSVANVLVQGLEAPGQIVRAIEYFNGLAEPPEVTVIIRGGGSADDLAAFNDEPLVRAVAASRVPILIGVGHETDVSLADLAADLSAATPSNAAQLLVPDREQLISHIGHRLDHQELIWLQRAKELGRRAGEYRRQALNQLTAVTSAKAGQIDRLTGLLKLVDPNLPLRRGYAIARLFDGRLLKRGQLPAIGQELTIESLSHIIKAGVRQIYAKKR